MATPVFEIPVSKHAAYGTSVAPAGTISLFANNVSGGIEPVFDFNYRRHLRGHQRTGGDALRGIQANLMAKPAGWG